MMFHVIESFCREHGGLTWPDNFTSKVRPRVSNNSKASYECAAPQSAWLKVSSTSVHQSNAKNLAAHQGNAKMAPRIEGLSSCLQHFIVLVINDAPVSATPPARPLWASSLRGNTCSKNTDWYGAARTP